MKISKLNKSSDIAAVVVSGNSLIVPSSLPDKDTYPTMHIGKYGASKTTGSLMYWSQDDDTTPVYTGESITITF